MEFEARTKLWDKEDFSEWRPWDGNPDWALSMRNIFTGASRGMVMAIRHTDGAVIEFRAKEN